MPPSKFKRKLLFWREKIKHSRTVDKWKDEFRYGEKLRKYRHTVLGKWLYKKALQARAGSHFDMWEIVLPLDKYIEQFDKLYFEAKRERNPVRLKKIHQSMVLVSEEMAMELYRKSVRRGLIAADIPRAQWPNVWRQMRQYEGELVRNQSLDEAKVKAYQVKSRLNKELGPKFKKFSDVYSKTFRESRTLLHEYLKHVDERARFQ